MFITYYEDNSGVSDSRNYGINKDEGAYVVFVDSDDLLAQGALQSLINTMEKYAVDAVFGNHAYFYNEDKQLPRTPQVRYGRYVFDDVKDRFIDDGTLTGILFGSVCGGIKIGKNCLICTPILPCRDNCLLEIKDRVVISTDVTFVLHDYSVSRVVKGKSNIFGKIVIGNNSFIGTRSVIMYGVELADNTIVAAGSVVTKSFNEGNVIIGGTPAKVIGTWDSFREKIEIYGNNAVNIKEFATDYPELLVRR